MFNRIAICSLSKRLINNGSLGLFTNSNTHDLDCVYSCYNITKDLPEHSSRTTSFFSFLSRILGCGVNLGVGARLIFIADTFSGL